MLRRSGLPRCGCGEPDPSSKPVTVTEAKSVTANDAKVRLAVVGGGFGASHHWHEHPGCEVTAVADTTEGRLGRLMNWYSCERAFPFLEAMLDGAADAFDAVAIFTDPPNHAAHAIACMEAGKHVVSACPVGQSLEECRQVRDAKERKGLKCMLHESSYYRQPCIAAREAYEAGEFGRIAYSELEYCHPGIGGRANTLTRWQGANSWRWGVPPLLYPTHPLGYLVGVTGERIVKVSALGQLVSDDFSAGEENRYNNPFDNEMALGITDQGNICRFGVFWSTTAHGERAQWLGEKMSCYMSSSSGQPEALQQAGEDWAPWGVPEYWKTDRLPEPMRRDSGHGGSAAFLCAEFVEALLTDREPAIDIYEAIAMTAPGIVAHESALQGGVQLDVPQFDRN